MKGLSVEARYLEPEIPPELDQTYRRTFARLKGLFRARGCTPEEAADLAQEAAMRAYMHVQRWGATGDLDPLINRIARNLLIDRHRRVAPHLVPLENAADVHDPQADPTEEVIRRQESNEIRSAVNELSSRHQTALMYSMGGMSPAEVGDRLGIGRNAADALLHRARRSLRERLRHVGEGALGIGVWFRIRIRNAAGRAGISGPVEAAGTHAVSAGVATAAAIVAAISVVNPGGWGGSGGGAIAAPKPIVLAAAHDRDANAEVPGVYDRGSGGSGANSGGTGVGTPFGSANAGSRDGDFNSDIGVQDPEEPERRLLGVGPDVIHNDNDNSTTGTTFDRVCRNNETTCGVIYESPSGGDDEPEPENEEDKG